jgi:hypothetical protein
MGDVRGAPVVGRGKIDFDCTTFLVGNTYFFYFVLKIKIYFLIDGIISVLTFTRTAINNVIFEVFVRSINNANKKKL